MKHEKKLSCVVGSVLAFVIALAGIGCIDSAFSLNADMELLGGYLVLWAALCGICFYFRRGGTVFLCICAVLAGFLLREGTLEQEVESLLYHLSKFYDGGYGCGIIYWSTADFTEITVNGGLFVIGAAVLSILSLVLCRRKNELPAMLAAIVPLGICLVVTDTIPSVSWLFLLLTGLALLLLTHPVRKKRAADGIRLTAMMLVPVLLASMLLFVLTPQDNYFQRLTGLQKLLSNFFYTEAPGPGPSSDGPGIVKPKDQVDLTNVGKREDASNPVLEVLAEGSQTLYLRIQSFDTYDGLMWKASEYSTGVDPYWPTEGLENIGYVRINTKVKQEHMLLPYYIAAESWKYDFIKGAYLNQDQHQYSIYQKVLVPDSAGLSGAVNYQSALVQHCLRLPEKTAHEWKQILAEVKIPISADIEEAVELIGGFVRNSALYDLNTGLMPKDREDFGVWFLNESGTGYCIHFATAATMLLRAQGIPARYVNGYVTDVQQGIRKSVTGNEGHAWVEYLHPQLGWQILEATPGFSVSTPAPPEESKPTEPTDPIETNPPETSEPTEPTETDPPETTKPTEPTETKPQETTAPTSTDTTEPTEPGQTGVIGNGNGNGQGRVDWSQIRNVILRILGVILAFTLIIAQRGMRIRHRKKRMYSGEANQQAIARWKYVLRLRRLLRQKMPAHLHELAQKAAYSQHTLTKQELAQFDAWLDEAKKTLQTKPWYLRFAYKWILAVI